MFFGLIGRNFKGKYYVFDPEDSEARRVLQDKSAQQCGPQFQELLQEYEGNLRRHEQLKQLKE